MKKIRLVKYFILFIMLFLMLGCGKGDPIAITVHNLDGKTFELGEKINLQDAFITVVYENGDKEDVAITHNNVDMADLLNAYSSLGEKKINIYYEIEGIKFNEEVTIYIVESGYKTKTKKAINEYNNDVVYSDDGIKKVNNLKVVYCNYVSNAVSEEEANSIFEMFKNEIAEVYTLDEENYIYTIEEVSKKINDLENKINIFINYDESTIKNEIESLKVKVENLQKNLKDEFLYEKIESLNLTVNSLTTTINNVQGNVVNNNDKITALTELMNSVLSQLATKDELANAIDNVTNAYLDAITKTFENQKFIVELRVNEGYIEYRYYNTNHFEKLIAVSELNGEEVDTASINESGNVVLRLKNNKVINTNVNVDVMDLVTFDEINEDVYSDSLNNIKGIVKEYINNEYSISNYDYNLISDDLGKYYLGYLDYVKLTKYDVKDEVEILLSECMTYIENDLCLDSESFDIMFNYEKLLEKFDTNLDVCKSFFASLLEKENINEERKEAFKNRILTTRSIESVIMLYEEALN